VIAKRRRTMIRTIVYPTPGNVRPQVATETPEEDDYSSKLVKYIPGEVIAFFVPAYALAAQVPELWARWLVLVLCVLGTVGYLFARASKEKPPRWYFYVLALLSFLAWAMGTSKVATELFRINDPGVVSKLIVTAAVFLIPLADELLTRLLPGSSVAPAPQPVP
jgi:hypothetical protein